MNRTAKEELVSHYNGIFKDAGVIVVTHYSGLTMPDLDDLRHRMADVGGTVKVTKNRLVKLALTGTRAEPIGGLFSGPTAIAYSEDPIAAPKIAAEFAEENENLVILGGVMDETVLDAEAVKELAALPSLDALRAKLVGMISTPATRIAGVLAAPAAQVARVLGAKAEQGDAA